MIFKLVDGVPCNLGIAARRDQLHFNRDDVLLELKWDICSSLRTILVAAVVNAITDLPSQEFRLFRSCRCSLMQRIFWSKTVAGPGGPPASLGDADQRENSGFSDEPLPSGRKGGVSGC